MPALSSGTVPAYGYGVPGDSVAAALPASVSNDWLQQDTTSVKGVAASGPDHGWPQQAVPTGDPALPVDAPEFDSLAYDGWYADPEIIQDEPRELLAVPGIGDEPFGTEPDDGVDTYTYAISSKQFTGSWEMDIRAPGSNLISQQVDAAGWQVNEPSGRVAVRRRVGQSYPGVEPFWIGAAPRPAVTRTAFTAQPVNGYLAEYGGVYNAGGNIALQPPPPPAVSDVAQAPESSADGLNLFGSF